jgi:hypothetical protein
MTQTPPRLRARFILDERHKPRESKKGDFEIVLSLDGLPNGTDEVMYRLHETYYDPLRVVTPDENNPLFEEEITSYGDYIVTARAKHGTDFLKTRQSLHKALYETHGHDPNPDVQRALKLILEN